MDAVSLQYDRTLDIAKGNSRKTKVWKNTPMRWSDMVARLSRETRTPETVAEYRTMTRVRQSEIKDCGGFVGGYCNKGNRSDIRHRSILCLDADYADSELWADWLMVYDKAAAVYSTHKHTPENPRLRLVIPLARDVTPDEYQAIGRRVAADLGIDKFDDTTYQPQRMMYWPSCSQDGEYYFQSCDAPLLEPDAVLATYHSWSDVSSWPMSSRVAEVFKKTAEKQKDPLEKGGIVGAFCRAYSIEEAIEAFVPTYQPCNDPGRYTYTEGSTAAGVVLYEGKFSYSHHATDPASGQLVNAWDLVRLHKYAGLDADSDPEKPVTTLPSYKAMLEFASEDPKVRIQLVNDRQAEADEFEVLPDSDDPDEWKSKLEFNKKTGALLQTIENVVTILSCDPKLAGVLAVNEMEHNIVARKSLPWREVTEDSQWTDSDDANLRLYLEREYGFTGKDKIFDGVNVIADKNAFHPVREYLNSCTWDGVSRVETLLIDYLGAEDNPYTRAVTRKTMVAAVSRIYRPGCKFDYMLTLRGTQGIGKSALIGKLGGKWFSDTFTTMQGKEAYEQLMGAWLVEVGELAGMRKAEAETIKLFISKQTDRFRPAYGRRLQEFPRQCVFIGTTNENQFLRDTTGNRRFWVVDTPNDPKKDMWEDLTEPFIRMIWAEAVEMYHKGEPLYLPRELEKTAREVQTRYEEENPKAGIVAAYLDRLLPENWNQYDSYDRRQWLNDDGEGIQQRQKVTTMEIFVEALGGNPDKIDRYAAKEIRDIMASFPEWQHQGNAKITVPIYGRQRYYVRKVVEG